MTITLYDIPSTIPGNAWTPNPFKARSVLNFKRIPYRTEWVEYPDIEDVSKKIGALPTEQKVTTDGSGRMVDHYTPPAIHDSKTGQVISDSYAIAIYLENTYLESPRLFPPGTHAAIALFNNFVNTNIVPALCILVLPTTCLRLNKKSQAYFRQTREFWYEMKLEELSPPNSERRDAAWTDVKQSLKKLSEFYAGNDGEHDGPYFIGGTFTYADIIIGSFLHWPKLVLFKEDFDWEEFVKSGDVKWEKIATELEKYRQVL